MNGKKAKSLRRFAERMASFEPTGLPKVSYDVIEHVRTILVPPVTKEEKRQCYLSGMKGLRRQGKSFQIVLKDCQRRLYQFAKQSYKRQSWSNN